MMPEPASYMEMLRQEKKHGKQPHKIWVGSRLRQLRHQKKWSLTDLSNATRVDRAYLSRLENGIFPHPRMWFIERVLFAMGYSWGHLRGSTANHKFCTKLKLPGARDRSKDFDDLFE